jgi:hypothetical protein
MRQEQERTERLHHKSPDTYPADPYDCRTCKSWGGGILYKMRCCWVDEGERLPISLWREEDGSPATALIMRRSDLYKFLPLDEILAEYLQGDAKKGIAPKVTCRGKVVCPAPLTWVGGLREVLQWQADLDAWGSQPFDGPTSTWPAGTLDALRHIRGMIGILQARRMDRMDEEQ